MRPRAQRREINFKKNYHDRFCIILTLLGYSRRFVAAMTQLTEGQCDRRCYVLGVRRKFYRDGMTDFTANNLEQLLAKAERYMKKTYGV